MRKLMPLILILLLIPSIMAITWPNRNIAQDIRNAIAGNPVWPYDTIRNIFFFVFLPFWGSFAIFYGLLIRLRVFTQKRINILLALIFSMSLLYYGLLTWLISIIYTIGGFVTVMAFFIIFFLGVYLFGRKKEAGWRADVESAAGISKELSRARKELKRLENELQIVREDLTDTRSATRIKQLKQREDKLLAQIQQLRENIVNMKTKGETLRSDLITGGD